MLRSVETGEDPGPLQLEGEIVISCMREPDMVDPHIALRFKSSSLRACN